MGALPSLYAFKVRDDDFCTCAQPGDLLVFSASVEGHVGDMVAVWSGTDDDPHLEGVGLLKGLTQHIILLEPMCGIDPPARFHRMTDVLQCAEGETDIRWG